MNILEYLKYIDNFFILYDQNTCYFHSFKSFFAKKISYYLYRNIYLEFEIEYFILNLKNELKMDGNYMHK